MNLSSPNRIVWNYFEALRRRVAAVPEKCDEPTARQDIVVCTMLAVLTVETFLNVYLRVVVSEDAFRQHEAGLLADLRRRRSLDYKLRSWPTRILGKSLDATSPIPARFLGLKDRRNQLMHFTSTHETVQWIEGESRAIVVQGLADTTTFDSLDRDDATGALEVAEGMVCEILRLRGIPDEQLPAALHLWTGKVPGAAGERLAQLSLKIPIPPVTRSP